MPVKGTAAKTVAAEGPQAEWVCGLLYEDACAAACAGEGAQCRALWWEKEELFEDSD